MSSLKACGLEGKASEGRQRPVPVHGGRSSASPGPSLQLSWDHGAEDAGGQQPRSGSSGGRTAQHQLPPCVGPT